MRRLIFAGALLAGLLLAGCVSTPPQGEKMYAVVWESQYEPPFRNYKIIEVSQEEYLAQVDEGLLWHTATEDDYKKYMADKKAAKKLLRRGCIVFQVQVQNYEDLPEGRPQ